MKASRQPFERGDMFWYDAKPGLVFAIATDGWWMCCKDEWDQYSQNADVAPDGLMTPQRGFGYAWREYPAIKERLGWATSPEERGTGDCKQAGDGWELRFGADYYAKLSPRPEPEPTPAPTPAPTSPPESKPKPPTDPGPDLQHCQACPFLSLIKAAVMELRAASTSDRIVLPSGVGIDLRYCGKIEPIDGGAVIVRWVYGDSLSVGEDEKVTMHAVSMERFEGDDAKELMAYWLLTGNRLPLEA